MRKFIEIAKISFKSQIAFRSDVLMMVFFTMSKILLAYILWGAIFNRKPLVAGFTYPLMVSYYIISAFLAQMDLSGTVSSSIGACIKMGTFSKYMIIPVDTQGYFTARTLGIMAYYLIFMTAATGIWIILPGIDLMMTNNIWILAATLLLVMLGLLFMIQLNYFLGILAFKFEDIRIFLLINGYVIGFITGTMVPLVLLPPAVLAIMRFLPFYYVTYLPSMLLIGRNENEMLTGFVVLTCWLLVFYKLNRLTYQKYRVIFDGAGL